MARAAVKEVSGRVVLRCGGVEVVRLQRAEQIKQIAEENADDRNGTEHLRDAHQRQFREPVEQR